MIGDLVVGYVQSLKTHSHFFPKGTYTDTHTREQQIRSPNRFQNSVESLNISDAAYYTPTRTHTNTNTHTQTHTHTHTHTHTDAGPAEPPTAYLWSLYFCAQHYNRIGQSTKALELINTALDHTPTEVQLYMLKAKILKVRCIETSFVLFNTHTHTHTHTLRSMLVI